MINFVAATPSGAAENRPGTKYVAATKANGAVRRIPFIFSSDQTYVLEFGNLYLRFLQNGGQVIAAGVPYEIATPFTTAMLPFLDYDQVGDVMTICYRGQAAGVAAVAPRELKRNGHTAWVLSTASVFHTGNVFAGGTGIALAGHVPDATHPARPWIWCATEMWREDATGNIVEAQRGLLQPPLYNAGTTYAAGDQVFFGLSNENYTSLVNANLGNQPDVSAAQWVKGSVCYPTLPIRLNVGAGAKAGYTFLGWNFFRASPNTTDWLLTTTLAFGWVGSADATAAFFLDDVATPDFSWQPPHETDPFANPANDFPASVAFFEQRRIFGGTVFHPQRLSGSKPGQYSNFDVDLFVKNDDAVTFDIASAQLDEIRHLVSGPTLLALSQSGFWRVKGFYGEPLSPSSIDVKSDGKVGASWVKPARAGEDVLYVRERGSGISGAIWDGNYEKWRYADFSSFGRHLFKGHTVVALAMAQEPQPVLWAVREDGVLLGLTRFGDFDQGGVLAWHQHTTDGFVEDVCVVPEGTEDAVYLGVRRTINGATVRYHERMQTRLVTDARLGVFLDAAVTADGRSTDGTGMTFLSDSTYLGGEEGTITTGTPRFVAPDDVGDQIVLDPDGIAGGPFRLTILSITDALHVRAKLEQPLPAAFQNTPTTLWGFAHDSFTGLDHLEGKTVTVLGDGDNRGTFVVQGGAIQGVTPPAVVAQIGLPYRSTLELLDLAQWREEQKRVVAAVIEVVESRGFKVGETDAATDLAEWDDQRTVEVGEGPIPLKTGLVRKRIQGSFNEGGRIVIVQDEPLPLTVVAVTREVAKGGTL